MADSNLSQLIQEHCETTGDSLARSSGCAAKLWPHVVHYPLRETAVNALVAIGLTSPQAMCVENMLRLPDSSCKPGNPRYAYAYPREGLLKDELLGMVKYTFKHQNTPTSEKFKKKLDSHAKYAEYERINTKLKEAYEDKVKEVERLRLAVKILARQVELNHIPRHISSEAEIKQIALTGLGWTKFSGRLRLSTGEELFLDNVKVVDK